jgi:N,N-dimethylformamidase
MLIGYVSDERYTALPDAMLEFTDDAGQSWEARSRASGSVHADLPPGDYTATLFKAGFGSKRVRLSVGRGVPYHFRLLSDGLLGYAWPKCVRSGEAAEFRVHSVGPYKLELYRYGQEKELVRGLGWYDEHGPRATMQVTPDGDYTQTGVRWNEVGYISPAHKQLVTAPGHSGLYWFHASTAGGAAFSFPWVVAPAKPRARIAALVSDLNWNAYNNFGGRSNYIHADGFPPTPTVNSRMELKRYTEAAHQTWGGTAYPPLSFERPEPINHVDLSERWTDPIEGRSACHVAPAEWRMLAWMEREGFDHDVYSETQLHHGVLDLSAYRVLVLGPHPEYWTRRMYERVKKWVHDGGGRLVYLGGNGLNCEVELSADGRAMTCHNGTIRGLWAEEIGAESRFALRVEPESKLLGVIFTPAGIMTAAPYAVVDANHWAFAGTGLGAGDVFGEKSLHMRCPGGASGHETDKVSAASSPAGVRVLARGLNADGGGAEMAVYETPSGGAVFATGSITYSACLPVDEAISRVTANVLRRFLA